MELKTYLLILWRRWWMITITTVVVVASIVAGTAFMTPTYSASALVRVATATDGSVDWLNHNVDYTERLMNTYAMLAKSQPVLDDLATQLGVTTLPDIEVSVVPQSELLRIEVEATTATLASDAANGLAALLAAGGFDTTEPDEQVAPDELQEELLQIAESLVAARQEYEQIVAQSSDDIGRIAAAEQTLRAYELSYDTLIQHYAEIRLRDTVHDNQPTLVEAAGIPTAPSGPRRGPMIVLGALVGVVGGVMLAFVTASFDTRIRTRQQIEDLVQLPIIGEVGHINRLRMIPLLNKRNSGDQDFWKLLAYLSAADCRQHTSTLLVTSAVAGEGKSMVVGNLAHAIARSGKTVVTVDADLREPALHTFFKRGNSFGLSNVLQRPDVLDKALTATDVEGLHVLSSGSADGHPTQLLSLPAMTDLLKQLQQRYDYVLIDSPEFLRVADSAILAPAVQGVVLVVRQGHSQQAEVVRTIQQLRALHATTVGVIVNQVRKRNQYYQQPSRPA
jgi:non-specific protein-tyrosine kinase